jgi:hypothetical protein
MAGTVPVACHAPIRVAAGVAGGNVARMPELLAIASERIKPTRYSLANGDEA